MATGTRATAVLTRAGVQFTLHPYDHAGPAGRRASNDGYGEQAARALGVPTARIFKTLIATVGGTPVCAVVPVAGRLDVKALAAAAGGKRAELVEPAAAARLSGYVVGGISPVGLRTRLPTFVDASAESFATIYVSAGRRGLQVELLPADLLRVCDARVAPLSARGGTTGAAAG